MALKLSLQGRFGLLFAFVALVFVFHEAHEGHLFASRELTEAELHQKGLWKSPKLAVDAYLVRYLRESGQWEILLIQRKREPYQYHWALPGGFVRWMEKPEDAVRREVEEETHLVLEPSEEPVFVNFRGSPDRDPRTHTVSAAYAAKVTAESMPLLQRDDDAGAVGWFPLELVVQGDVHPGLAFDHGGMLREFGDWFEEVGRGRGIYTHVETAT